jgi:hypothetical protein
MPSVEKECAAKKLCVEYDALRKSYSEDGPRLLACSLYLTENLGMSITEHLQAFHGVFSSFAAGPDSIKELIQELTRLMDSSSQVQIKLRQEVNCNPFR